MNITPLIPFNKFDRRFVFMSNNKTDLPENLFKEAKNALPKATVILIKMINENTFLIFDQKDQLKKSTEIKI